MGSNLLANIREGKDLTLKQQIALTLQLSFPAIMSQISTIIMEYIDASMVGRLGANSSAAIGLVSSSTWLFGGITYAAILGFSVQAAQFMGAKEYKTTRNITKQGYLLVLAIGILLALIGLSISSYLPVLLGGEESIRTEASAYFRIFILFLPINFLGQYAGSMIQASGNMKLPGFLNVISCFLDVVFNYYFIYVLGLGVAGAALGTGASQLFTSLILNLYLLLGSPYLKLRKEEKFSFESGHLSQAFRLAGPAAVEQLIMGSAYVMLTAIVSPIGSIAVAAHSFAVTAESLCYMPGYGIQSAAMTLIGQSVGAGREKLSKRLSSLCVILGMLIMAGTGVFLYFAAPFMMGILTPDAEIQALGVKVLRIEAFAEPMFAASIVTSGVFRSAGDTVYPSIMNLISMWCVRITLAYVLAPKYGLVGVWVAMFIELNFRGIIFLVHLKKEKWLKPIRKECHM